MVMNFAAAGTRRKAFPEKIEWQSKEINSLATAEAIALFGKREGCL